MSIPYATVSYRVPTLHEAFTGMAYTEHSTTKENAMYEQTITKCNALMNAADKLIAVFLLGMMLAITPLVCSAAVIKAHVKPVRVPVMQAMQLKTLKHAVGGYNVMLTPVSALVPLPVRRK